MSLTPKKEEPKPEPKVETKVDTKKEEPKLAPKAAAPKTPEVLAGEAYAAFIAEPQNANMETQPIAAGAFSSGFLRGYAAAKGK